MHRFRELKREAQALSARRDRRIFENRGATSGSKGGTASFLAVFMYGTSIAWNGAYPPFAGPVVKRIDIMETQDPTLAQRASPSAEFSVDKSKRDDNARAEEAELEQLAERVSAARSVY